MKKIIEFGKFIVRNLLKITPYGRVYYARRKEAQREEVIRNLHTYGPEILRMVHEAFKREGVEYFVCDGTLLGIIREGGILKHDIDIDFTVVPGSDSPAKVLNICKKLGFKYFWTWTYDGKVGNIAFEYNGVHIDFDFLYQADELWQLLFTKIKGCKYEKGDMRWSVVAISRPKVESVVEYIVPKYNIKVNIPEDYDGYLTAEYGDWRTPDHKWREKTLDKVSEVRKLLPLPGIRITEEETLLHTYD